jgi:branched-chain amino acid transport system permease protein
LFISITADLFGGSLIKLATTEMLVKIVVVVGLYIFIGNSGIVSFGHVVFMLLGAYCTAWLALPVPLKKFSLTGLPDFLAMHQYGVFLAALVSGGLAAVFAALIGIGLMQASGIAASMAMFAVLAVVHTVYANWDAVTLGLSSIVGLPMYVNIWVALAWAAFTVLTAYAYQSSRFGLALRAAREDEAAAKASGIHIVKQRFIAFVLSAFFVGVGGALYAHFIGVISVETFYIEMTFVTLAMLVFGGMRSLSGAVIGVIAISGLIEFLRELEDGMHVGELSFSAPAYAQELGFAIIIILVLVFRPRGLMGDHDLSWPFRVRR